MGLSQSLPTPSTRELLRVVTRLAVGSPGLAFRVPTAPMAPLPFVPLVSTPVKLITVIEEQTDCESIAVTVTPLKVEEANALQISAVPFCVFVRSTRTQVSPPLATPVTVTADEEAWSAETNASKSSLAEIVENE